MSDKYHVEHRFDNVGYKCVNPDHDELVAMCARAIELVKMSYAWFNHGDTGWVGRAAVDLEHELNEFLQTGD